MRTSPNRGAWRPLLLLLLAFVLAGCSADHPAEPTGWNGLGAPRAYAVGGTSLVGLTAADATGDGVRDLVTVVRGQLTVGILPGRPGGVFGEVMGEVAGNDPRGAAVADVDDDGVPDLLVIGHFDNALFVRRGMGSGSYGTVSPYPLRNHGRLVAAGDINGDRYDDVVVVHDGSGQPIYVTVFLGTATGALTRAWEAGTPYTTAKDLVLSDFDGNGTTDLAIAAADDRASFILFYGLGTGGFGPSVALPSSTPGVPDGIQHAAAADLNGDGRDDLVAAHYDVADVVTVRLSAGAQLAPPRTLPIEAPFDVALADVDGDGRLDMIVSHADAGRISVLPGQGDGSFLQARQFSAGGSPGALATGDFDGDGWKDVAVADLLDHQIRVLRNEASTR